MTIRVRLTIAFLAVVLAVNLLLSLVTIRRVGEVLIEEVQIRVRTDLEGAREVYNNQTHSVARFLSAVALDETLVSGLTTGHTETLIYQLQKVHRAGRADMICLLDPAGQVLYPPSGAGEAGGNLAGNEVVASALRTNTIATGTILVAWQTLLRQGIEPQLLGEAAQATQSPTQPIHEAASGMVVAAAVPVQDQQGNLLGVLYGANLLNGQYRIVDTIKNLLFQNQVYNGKEIGTATIFQGDLRISTNVQTRQGQRAIGTRMSPEVAEVVLTQGQTFSQRAFAVNDWYLSAYEPIRSPSGAVIGSLYVGLLEEPYLQRQRMFVGVFAATVVVMAAVTIALLWLITKMVLRPIGRVIHMARRVIGGDLTARVGIRRRGEMGMLLKVIDEMADAVYEREDKLKAMARQQIGQSEKLASIGRLAAGVAHEVNNPLTGVLTFAHLLRDKHKDSELDRSDLDLIIRETTRVRDIVRGLLDFARESPSRRLPLDINGPVHQMLTLLRSQKEFKGIRIEEDLAEGLPKVSGDQNQLQQVLLNLALNACEAMPGGGVLSLRTWSQGGHVLVEVRDSGLGIPAEHMDKIFDPFYTTKPVGKGTGLGLSVSYGIVQQHGGDLQVVSQEGKGSTFTVVLPEANGSTD